MRWRWVAAVAVLAVLAGACSDDVGGVDPPEPEVPSSPATTTRSSPEAPFVEFTFAHMAGASADAVGAALAHLLGGDQTQLQGDDLVVRVAGSDTSEPVGLDAQLSFAPLLTDDDSGPLGDSAVDGAGLESADAVFRDVAGNVISLVLRPGSPGIDDFNELAAECFGRTATCPTGRLAIVVDGEVLSAPTVNTVPFDRGAISISGTFTEAEAADLAARLTIGAAGGVELTSIRLID